MKFASMRTPLPRGALFLLFLLRFPGGVGLFLLFLRRDRQDRIGRQHHDVPAFRFAESALQPVKQRLAVDLADQKPDHATLAAERRPTCTSTAFISSAIAVTARTRSLGVVTSITLNAMAAVRFCYGAVIAVTGNLADLRGPRLSRSASACAGPFCAAAGDKAVHAGAAAAAASARRPGEMLAPEADVRRCAMMLLVRENRL
jgi:hypothetical protein